MACLVYRFGPFTLDVCERRVSRSGEVIPLPGKIFDTLRLLVENHDHLVRKDELIRVLWPDSVVEDNNIDHNVSTIRKALGQRRDEAKYIETVPRQGYRFVAPVVVSDFLGTGGPVSSESRNGTPLVERNRELSELRAAFRRAACGTRQFVAVTGELGTGKTALVRSFIDQITGIPATGVARGDCQRQYSHAEPYMPLLEAMSRLFHQDGGVWRTILDATAPSWMARLRPPGRAERTGESASNSAGIPEGMMREMAEAVELLTAANTLVLVLEDVHWADYPTIDLLARIAGRTEPARLLMIATYRPSCAKARLHPIHTIAQQLKVRDSLREVPLASLSVDGYASFLSSRFGDIFPDTLIRRLHAWIGGNPLFLMTLVNSWVESDTLRQVGGAWQFSRDPKTVSLSIPGDLGQLVEQELAELCSLDQTLVEAAAVAGFEFCPAAIADALDLSASEAEVRASSLAKRGALISVVGVEEWPDGTVCDRYRFLHRVYRDVVYEITPAGRRVRLHQLIGCRLEQGFSGQEDEVAGSLAMHFQKARDPRRAVLYFQRAAKVSLSHCARSEALAYLRNALALLTKLSDPLEAAHAERDIRSLLPLASTAPRGGSESEY